MDIEEPLFQPFPSDIVFQNFNPYETYQVPLQLRNNDKVNSVLFVCDWFTPSTLYDKIHCLIEDRYLLEWVINHMANITVNWLHPMFSILEMIMVKSETHRDTKTGLFENQRLKLKWFYTRKQKHTKTRKDSKISRSDSIVLWPIIFGTISHPLYWYIDQTMIKMLPDLHVYSVHVRAPFSLISAYWYFEMWCVTVGFNLSYQFTELENMNTSHVLSIMYTIM